MTELSTAQVGESPFVSAVICTRNRGASVLAAIRSVLSNDYPYFELVIIDQSTNDETEKALGQLGSDPRLRYVQTQTRGSGLARDIGLNEAQGQIVVMTDDDCEVPTDWISKMTEIFVKYPEVVVVYCDVIAGPHDSTRGFIPISTSSESRLIKSLSSSDALGVGIGAGVAVRRATAKCIGGFDPILGAGTQLHSSEDSDIGLRALLRGYPIYRTRDVSVVHHGFRTYGEGRILMRGYMIGLAAMYAKLIKCGYWQMLVFLPLLFWRLVFFPIFQSLVHFQRPPVFGRAVYLVKGLFLGLKLPVDQQRGVFRQITI